MKDTGLAQHEIDLILSVFRRNPAISEVWLYGSRAKGTYRPGSDIDLALVGVSDDLQIEQIWEELGELPLPYKFGVRAFEKIKDAAVQEHIKQIGIRLYRRSDMA